VRSTDVLAWVLLVGLTVAFFLLKSRGKEVDELKYRLHLLDIRQRSLKAEMAKLIRFGG
jgi:hypothetical protein